MKKIGIINFMLLILILFFSYSIFKTKDYNFAALYNTYKTMSNHINIGNKDVTVSNAYLYNKIDKYTYNNNSFEVFSPISGTIIYKDDNTLIIKTIDNYKIVFDNVINICVSKYDVVKTSDLLANFIDYFKMYFIKGEKIYSYEEICKNN